MQDSYWACNRVILLLLVQRSEWSHFSTATTGLVISQPKYSFLGNNAVNDALNDLPGSFILQ